MASTGVAPFFAGHARFAEDILFLVALEGGGQRIASRPESGKRRLVDAF
jgi:hypothetical protein